MEIATRTSEGTPSNCPECGKRIIVSASTPLGDAICPHCGSLIFPRSQRDRIEGDDEKRLADLGVIVETNDQGEITVAKLHGPRLNDSTIQKLVSLKEIPLIRLGNTGLTQMGIDRLRTLINPSIVEEIDSSRF